MSIILLVTFQIRPEAAEQFEALVANLAQDVLASEPGVSHYQLARSKSDPKTYHMWEVYADKAALEAHGKTAHMAAARSALMECLAMPPVIEFHEPVAAAQ